MKTFRFTFELSDEIYLFKVTQVFEVICNQEDYDKILNMCKYTSNEYKEFLEDRRPGEVLCLLDTEYGEDLMKYFKFEKDIFQKVIIGFSSFKVECGNLVEIFKLNI